MSEKRFELILIKYNDENDVDESWWAIKDNETDKTMQDMETVELLNEQQATISALKDIFKDIITYSEWDSKKPYCSLRIAVDKKTYYKIREILNE